MCIRDRVHDARVQGFGCFINVVIKPLLPSPHGGFKLGGVDCKMAHSSQANFSTYGRFNHKRSDADGEFAELHGSIVSSQTVISSRNEPHAAADGLALYPPDDELGTLPHGVDNVGKFGEEYCPFFDRSYCRQFGQRCPGAEGTVAARLQNQDG